MNNSIYPLICFHILTGKEKVSPLYLQEKIEILNDGLNAFNWLDYKNMGKVLAYCEAWHIDIPPEWAERYRREMDAAREAGFNF